MTDEAVSPADILMVVERVAVADRQDTFGIEALQAVQLVVPFDQGSYNEVDTADQRAHFSAWPPEDVGADDRAEFGRLVQQNPILQHQQRTGDGSPHRISDFISSEEFRALELYERVFAPRGIEYQVAFGLTVKEPLYIAMALNRCDRDFSDAEISLLDALRPHLARAHRNVRASSALRGIDGVLADAGRAVVLLDTTGDATVPPWAREALRRHHGPLTRAGLPARVARWVEEERRAYDGGDGMRIPRSLDHVVDGRQLVLQYIPATPDRPAVVTLEERAVDLQADETAPGNLTPREQEVFHLLRQGASSTGIAERLGVRRATVDKHLEHVYRKLGVASRTAAIAAASNAAVALRSRPDDPSTQ